jgi:endonuclease G
MLTGKAKRGNNFRPDPFVISGSAQLIDYKNSGYDKGHLCPAGDMGFNEEAMSETFYLSNMSPQVPAFNRGIWKSLETIVRDWAIEEDSIYIVTGGILSHPLGFIGPDRVSIPSMYYKVIYDLTGEKKMIAFILPNEIGSKPLPDYAVSVSDVEKLTGIIFFPCLADSLRNKLEGKVDIAKWNFDNTHTSSGKNMRIHIKANNSNKSVDYRQCIAITKSGKQCTWNAQESSDYCKQHARKANSN